MALINGSNSRRKGSCSGAADGEMRGGHVSKVCDGTLRRQLQMGVKVGRQGGWVGGEVGVGGGGGGG